MQQIVECIPNFSNGRSPDVYNSIADAIRTVPSVRILHVSANTSHNRTVITFVGSLDDVAEGAFRAIARAAELIDMNQHQGDHPRIGATDVCPFVPIKGVSLEECINMAHRLGERVSRELGIAVYFYGHAAKSPQREQLTEIRRGEYEVWQREIGVKPERNPDCGPAEPRAWGATIIGVRPFLIAYNLYLNTHDVAYAKKIAKAVRHSNGGLRYLLAKGYEVDGQVQVSMNLTNFEKTPLHLVQEMVKQQAAHYGLTVTRAELVGMIPQKALMETAKWYLQLDEMRDDQVLEYRLYDESTEMSIVPTRFLEATANNTPTPGGGPAAALAGALAAALTQMVAGLTVGRKKYADVQDEVREIEADARELREQLTKAVSEDSAAYNRLMFALRNTQVDEAARETAVSHARLEVALIPLHVARLSRRVAHLAKDIVEMGNINAVTDAAVGALLAQTAVRASGLNIRTNSKNMADKMVTAAWEAEIVRLEKDVDDAVTAVLATAQQRGVF